jgi:hypothetical protein
MSRNAKHKRRCKATPGRRRRARAHDQLQLQLRVFAPTLTRLLGNRTVQQ